MSVYIVGIVAIVGLSLILIPAMRVLLLGRDVSVFDAYAPVIGTLMCAAALIAAVVTL